VTQALRGAGTLAGMRRSRARTSPRRFAGLALCALIAACSGAPATPGPSATGTASNASAPGQGTPAPADTGQPVDTVAPTPAGPLPGPSLGSADELVAALGDPGQSEQVVVSMLALLGIGLYQPDGTAIRQGTELSDDDFYVFEPVARGLANMLRLRNEPRERTSFRNYHAALVSGGYTGTADELAAAFAGAYAAQPDSVIARLVAALGPIDVNATLPSFELWLLTLDGFIKPNSGLSATAMARGAGTVTMSAAGWGIAASSVRLAASSGVNQWSVRANLLLAVAESWTMQVVASPTTVHEGHGGSGAPMKLTAILTGPMVSLNSAFGGGAIIPRPVSPVNLPVDWLADARANEHGQVNIEETVVVQSGSSTNSFTGTTDTRYTPDREQVNGAGVERQDTGAVLASVVQADLLTRLYGSFVAPYLSYIYGIVAEAALFTIGWHEKPEAVIKIVWTDFYNGVEDRITFLGNLTTKEKSGTDFLFTGAGTATGDRSGWAACNPGIGDVPRGTATARFEGTLNGDGTITIFAYADVTTQLAGVSTAPMTVPLAGGRAVFTSAQVGELCPHSSDGEMIVYGLSLP
jgi:hypothetical protein